MTDRRDRLEGWKQIADYLGCCQFSARTWRAQKGLPVKQPGGRNSAVYASAAELDEWLARNPPRADDEEAV